MPDPTAREALESFHSWLVARRHGLVTSAELLGPTHGESDREWRWRAKGLEIAIADLEIRISALKDSKAVGAYDSNGNPRTTPVRTSLPASLCPNIGGEPRDDEFTEYEMDILWNADGRMVEVFDSEDKKTIPTALVGLVEWKSKEPLHGYPLAAALERTADGEAVVEAAIEGAARAAAIIAARQDGTWDVGNDPHPPLDDPNPESEDSLIRVMHCELGEFIETPIGWVRANKPNPESDTP